MPTDITEEKAKTINKYPLAVLVGVVCSLLTLFANKLFDSNDARVADCIAESDRKDKRIHQLETNIDKYTNAVLFQNSIVRNRDEVIDSLKRENENLKTNAQ